jgi:hypothetical protein
VDPAARISRSAAFWSSPDRAGVEAVTVPDRSVRRSFSGSTTCGLLVLFP